MSYLIDTNIIIYSLKGSDKVNAAFRANENIPKSLSVVTYGELLYGAKKSQQIAKNLATVYKVKELFPVIPVDNSVMETFSDLKQSLSQKGKIVDDFDLLIAATAMVNNMTLVTNNVKHFENIDGLKIENWAV